jgi:hypothetical protein
VVGLPGGIRPIRFSPVDQLKYVAVRFRAFVGESYKVCTQTADDIRNGTVARAFLAKTLREPHHLTL